MRPLLFSVGQHEAWTEVQSRLRPGQSSSLSWTTFNVVCRPGRSGAHSVGERSLGVWPHPGPRREDKNSGIEQA